MYYMCKALYKNLKLLLLLSLLTGLASYQVESSASATQDYIPINELLDFPSGTQSQLVSIQIVNDNIPEETEHIVVKLSNPINAVLGEIESRKSVITIYDQDCKLTLKAVACFCSWTLAF